MTTTETNLIQWRRVEAAGLLTVGFSLFAFIAVNLAFIPPVLIFGAIYSALGMLVWRYIESSRVALICAGLGLLGLIANLPFIIEDLSYPASWGSFIPQAIAVIAGLAGIGAGVISVVRPALQSARAYATATIALSVIAMLASIGLFLAAGSDIAQPGDVTLAAEKFEYPATLQADAGLIGFHVSNNDVIHHTFVIEGADFTLTLPARKQRRADVQLAAGQYRFFCDIPGHESMQGTLLVR